jgi:hypothetical protein
MLYISKWGVVCRTYTLPYGSLDPSIGLREGPDMPGANITNGYYPESTGANSAICAMHARGRRGARLRPSVYRNNEPGRKPKMSP